MNDVANSPANVANRDDVDDDVYVCMYVCLYYNT